MLTNLQSILLIRDLYEGLIRPKMQVARQNWDNLSDDVCYINRDPKAQQRADGSLRDRQKDENDMNDVEKEAWKSPENCAKVCGSQDVPDEEEWDLHGVVGRNSNDPSTANDTEVAEDTSPSDAAAREAWKNSMNEKKRNRSCFQYRWHEEVCCTAKSFKLGAPKAAPDDDNPNGKWVSGWHLKGINDWIDAMGECTKPEWKSPEPS